MSYAGNPNSAHQLWSYWTFEIREVGRHVQRKDVEYNAAKWLCAGFGSAGRVRTTQTITGWRVETLIEGVPAHDPGYVASVRHDFQAKFVEVGWGIFAVSAVRVEVLAGDMENGKPRPQMIEMPSILS